MKRLLAALACSCLITLSLVSTAYADVNDFVIEHFDADYSLSNTDKQGQMRVVEQIKVNFSDYNHGILRAVPNRYKNHSLELHVDGVSRDGGAEPWSTYGQNGNTVLKIGDPNQTITGEHTYVISYTMRNVITFYSGYDELFWDINGTEWMQPAESVTARLTLPAGLQLDREPICYAGPTGTQDHACTVSVDKAANTVSFATTTLLNPRETLSIVAGFTPGFFRPSTFLETLGEYAGMVWPFAVPFLLIAGSGALLWFRRGRDARGRGVIVPEYEAPDGLRPLEAGTIVDFKTDNRDITATIIDLAIRGYITIIQTKKDRKLLPDVTAYRLRLDKGDLAGLTDFESTILKDVFPGLPVGQEVDLSALKYKLASAASAIRIRVQKDMVARGYFNKNPLSFNGWGIFTVVRFVVIFAVIVLSWFHTPTAAMFGAAAGFVVAGLFIVFLPSRTARGVAAKESILGLKMYLEVAEAERIKMLQSPDAPYMPKSPEPEKTVKLFEKLLPYAMVLGVEQKWAEQFENLYVTPPDWYQGNWTTFNAIYLTSALSGGLQSGINSAFAAPASSSGSGFGGGGAGGGGGGGGGGGW